MTLFFNNNKTKFRTVSFQITTRYENDRWNKPMEPALDWCRADGNTLRELSKKPKRSEKRWGRCNPFRLWKIMAWRWAPSWFLIFNSLIWLHYCNHRPTRTKPTGQISMSKSMKLRISWGAQRYVCPSSHVKSSITNILNTTWHSIQTAKIKAEARLECLHAGGGNCMISHKQLWTD